MRGSTAPPPLRGRSLISQLPTLSKAAGRARSLASAGPVPSLATRPSSQSSPCPCCSSRSSAAPCRRSGAPREATAKAPAVDLLRLLRLRLRLLLGWSSSCSVPISAHSLLSFGAGQTLDTLWLKDGPFVCGQSQVSVADLLLACETDELCLLDGAEQVDPAAAAAAASAATAAAAAAAGSTS